MRNWNELSMAEKADVMKLAIEGGVYDLDSIRNGYNKFAEGGGMEESMNTIPEDYAPLASPTWQPAINKMKQDSYKSNVEDFAYRVQKMHPEITQQQGEEAYKSVPIIASDSRRGRELGKYVFGDESGYGQRIMLYPNRMKEDQSVGGLTKEDQLGSAMGHETNHLYVHTLLGDNHTDEEKALLDAAYPDDLFHVPEGGNIYDEKRAYNMQVRNALSKTYGNVVGADYDKATKKMKPNDVMWNYSQLGSGYMSDYQKVKQKYKKGSKWDQNQVDAILKATKDVAYNPTVNPYEYGEGVNYAALGGPIVEAAMNEYKNGGGIHIAPSKKGTFTAAAKKHGKSVQAFASQVLAHPENYSPAMRKKANFARNAAKWKHEEGGNLYPGGGFLGLMPAMPGIIATKEGKEFLSKAYHGIKQFIGLEDTEEKLRKKRNADRYATSGYIGGEPRDTRQKYFDVDKEFTDSVNSISKRYGLNPSIVASRIAEEGPIDQAIIAYNDENNVGTQGQVLSDNGKGTYGPLWGLDDFYTRVTNNDVRVTTTAPYTYKKQNFINEQDRTTESITSPQWWFGIEATAAEMKARRDKLKKNNPWMTNQQLDAATAMSFNYGESGVQKHINSKKPIPKRFNPYIKTK